MKHIISLGAGVQSSTMALMAAQGEITPMPDAAIFADTQWEPRAVYDWLNSIWLNTKLPFPIYKVTKGSLRDAAMNRMSKDGSKRAAAIPWFIKLPNGQEGMGRRQCTREYKIEPVRRKIRELLGSAKNVKPGAISLWIGISTDEAGRINQSHVKYITNRYPLIEQSMNRNDCLQWMKRHGYPEPPRSSCIGCPFHNDSEWRAIKADPISWVNAVEVDSKIRHQTNFKGEQFAHRSMVPLDQVDFSTDEDRGQLNMFNNECEGMCGV